MRTVVAAFAAVILGLLFFAYQSPRVQELFRSSPRPRAVSVPDVVPGFETSGKPAGNPSAESDKKPVSKTSDSSKRATRKSTRSPAPAPPPKRPKPTVPNAEVTRVLNGVLPAYGIQGLAFSVTDDLVEVSGQVASEAQRKKVLAIIEKARETRAIDAKGLTVAGQ